jgi:VWFA-related protein
MRKLNRIISIGLLLLLALSTFGIAAAQEQGTQIHITQVDNSKFPQVTVYVSATDASGQPVGVDRNTIQIYEDGQLMEPTSIAGGGQGGAGPLTTMLVIDVSGSMEKNNKIGAAKEAAKSYVSQMRSGDQAGLIAFDSHVYTVQAITTDTGALSAAIDGLQPGSDTAMYDGILAATQALEGVTGRKAVIVLSDGLDNRSSASQDAVVNAVGPSGLTISSIGFGDPTASGQAGIDEAGLKSLASRTGGQYAYASDAQAVSALFQLYGATLQNEYVVTYISPATLRNGVNRNLTVSLAGSATTAEGKYNPGGVLPEVGTASANWKLFGGILLGLVVLLAIPFVIGSVGRIGGGGGGFGRKKSRVKLNKAAASGSPGKKGTGTRIKFG